MDEKKTATQLPIPATLLQCDDADCTFVAVLTPMLGKGRFFVGACCEKPKCVAGYRKKLTKWLKEGAAHENGQP